LRRTLYIAVFLTACLSVRAYPGIASGKAPEVAEINGQVHGREARVSFTIRNAFTPEMVEALKSGIEISFKTEVRIEKVRRHWFNDVPGAVEITRSVRYDALSRVFRLNRNGREELLPEIFSALAGMTQYEATIPLDEDAEKGKLYRARVRTRLDRVGLSEPLRSILFFSSIWDVETDWARGYLSTP
jgi:hypothetical protein